MGTGGENNKDGNQIAIQGGRERETIIEIIMKQRGKTPTI